MPELPEVETLTRALSQVLPGRTLTRVRFHRSDLRFPIPVRQFTRLLQGEKIDGLRRRSKYLLMETRRGTGIFHLGMSGNMFVMDQAQPRLKHTHAVLKFEDKTDPPVWIHFVDPRRFGVITCCPRGETESHPFFVHLGPEPLGTRGLATHLQNTGQGRSAPVKNFIMDQRHVVGVGNIYASESLFRARIHPLRETGSLSREEWQTLAREIRATLREAIRAGGTSFSDFRNPDGNPGYFSISLKVYGRGGEPCRRCRAPVETLRLGGRSTFFCEVCQN